jgi:ribosomal protein S18 acetylase RimI-like enzyme
VDVRSIAWRTDLHLRCAEGAQVTDHDEFLAVHKHDSPGFRWGNFLLLSERAAARADGGDWLARFEDCFPGAEHVALGLESPRAELGRFRDADLGLSLEVNSVLTAERLTAVRRPPREAVMRPLAGDDDWAQGVSVKLANDDGSDGSGYAEFAASQMNVARAVCERGEGAWFGAFRDGGMLAGLGIFRAGEGLARFQSVDTRPEHRGQGLASGLLLAAAEHARTEFGARTLVIVADPGYHAIGIYRSLGFREVCRQALLERAGPAA